MRNLDGTLRRKSLTVHAELPRGVTEGGFLETLGLREADGTTCDGYKHFHYCARCGGWIEGWPDEWYVNNFAPQYLAGRMGHSYECRRCGDELAFLGAMS